MRTRKEKDALGFVEVLGDAYYGSETQRTINCFKISGLRVDMELVYSYVRLKKATAIANMKAQKLDKTIALAIQKACDNVLLGKFDNEFILDPFQSGAGTSLNMNVNEVLANIAIESLGGKKGDYKKVHPNDHVNMSQSTNDTYPTAVNMTCYKMVHEELLPSLKKLMSTFELKAREFSKIVKIGRTHLQDAVPMKLGEEFDAYAGSIKNCIVSLQNAERFLLYVPLTGTAVGTGLNTGSLYKKYVLKELRTITGIDFKYPEHIFTNMSFRQEQLELSNSLNECAVTLSKICNDMRLLTSGPRAGLGEIILPAVLPGSSIMPGKINPSILEMLNMVCFRIMGSSASISNAVAGGQLELNVFTPLISYELIFSIKILSNAIKTFESFAVKGIKANKEKISGYLEMDLELATALNQYIGYAKAAKIANIALKEGKSIKQVCIEHKILNKELLDKILDPKNDS